MHHKDATLASAARQRKVTMIADQGDWEAAWALFHESLRLQPDRLVEIAENPVHAFSSPSEGEPEVLAHLRPLIDARQPFDVVYELQSSTAVSNCNLRVRMQK